MSRRKKAAFPAARRATLVPWGVSRATSAHSTKDRRDLFEAFPQGRRQPFQRGQEVRVGHTGTQERPAQRLVLSGYEFSAFILGQPAPSRAAQVFQIELGLLAKPVVEEAADLQVLIQSFFQLSFAAPFGQRFDHQSVEFGVLRFFHPVMLEQALELRVESSVVLYAFGVMLLRHPFDVQGDQGNGQRVVRENGLGDGAGRADEQTFRPKPIFKLLAEMFEEVDVFGLFGGESQEGPYAIIVALQLRTRVIEHEGQNELFDKTEGAEVIEAANLIQLQLFGRRQEAEFLYPRERFRHEGLGEAESLVAADDVFQAPVRFLRSGQRFLIAVMWFGRFLCRIFDYHSSLLFQLTECRDQQAARYCRRFDKIIQISHNDLPAFSIARSKLRLG